MRTALFIFLLALGFNGIGQSDLASKNLSLPGDQELPLGAIAGLVTTIDNKPAGFVTIAVKEINRFAVTDENGQFIIRNVKEGHYIIEVSMVGLKSIEKTIDVRKDQQTNVTLFLEEDAKQLEAVTVIARKTLNERPVSIGKITIDPMDLPQSIAVVGQASIKEQQSLRLSDIIKNVNGVYLTTTRGGVQESFAARGYSFSSTNLFKNGFRINSGVIPEVSSLEKLEILKGSAAILYGQVAPGGILNMVTKQPKFETGGELSMMAGSNDLYKPVFDIYAPLGSSVAFRIDGTFETANSFRDNVHSKRYYINPSLLFKLGKRTELVVEGDYLKHTFTPDFGIGTIDNTKIPDLPRSRFLGAVWSYNTTRQLTSTASLKHQFNDRWSLNASSSYQLYKRDYFSTERIQAAANGDWTRPLGRINSEEAFYAAQVNLAGKFKTGTKQHTFLTGIDADRSMTTNNDFSFPAITGLPAGSYDVINVFDPKKFIARTDIPSTTHIRKREAPVNRFGAYVQDLVKLSSKFNILAGVRWSYVETIHIDSTNLLTGTITKGNNKYDNAFSPRLGLVYKPAQSTSVFASYASSFSVNSGTDIFGSTLKPSIIDQYEVGIKNDFFKGLLSANVTVYRILNNNLAQTAPFDKDGNQNSNTAIKVLSGQTTSDGIEVDVAAQPVKGLSVLAGYSHNYTRYTKTDTIKGNFIEGEKLVNNPANTANGSIFYTVGKGLLKGFKLGATAIYIGDRLGGNNNTIGQTQNYSRVIPVNGYGVLDVSAGYARGNLSLMVKISNVTNTLNYYVHENYSINPLAPRQFVSTISYKF